jgi:hypothetical protein
MGICPYCQAEVHIKDFFEYKEKLTKKGETKIILGKFKGESAKLAVGYGASMFTCPFCNKILGLGFSG